MRIYTNIHDMRGPFKNACATIGNFDGVHLGHQKIFQAVKRQAKRISGVSVAVTFDPHPLRILKPGGIQLISTLEQKTELIGMSGMDALLVIPFTRDFAATSADQFVDEILLGRLGVKKLLVGYDYAFGKGRTGDIAYLKQKGAERGFATTVIEAHYEGDVLVSSTKIRELVTEGKMRETSALLGRYYQIRGEVQRGKQRGGKEVGFPTANLHIDEEDLIPRRGVYACQVISDGICYGGVINIGYNPTFDEERLVAETHIFDFNRDVYGKPIKVNLLRFLRGEVKFSGVEELSRQISRDVVRAKEVIRRAEKRDDRLLW